MNSFKFDPAFIDRYKNFINSKEFRNVPSYAKSDYWQYHGDAISVDVSGNIITVGGKSGAYIPEEKGFAFTFWRNRLRLALEDPRRAKRYIMRKFGLPIDGLNLLSYQEAFENVMEHSWIADVDLAPYRINFLELSKKEGVVKTVEEIKSAYRFSKKYAVDTNIIRAYYYLNILIGYSDMASVETILEIGAGNGNLASIMLSTVENCRYIIVDLPETLCLSIPYLSDLFRSKKIVMPHEASNKMDDDWDILFLTVDQTNMIQDDTVSLAMNMTSFQEMTRKQIDEYFQVIQRSCKSGGIFFTANRVEKIPCGPGGRFCETVEPVNRFWDYPWNSNNEILVDEICRLNRLTQLDGVALRMERVMK